MKRRMFIISIMIIFILLSVSCISIGNDENEQGNNQNAQQNNEDVQNNTNNSNN